MHSEFRYYIRGKVSAPIRQMESRHKEEQEDDWIAFREAYNAALSVNGVKWNLSIGLYWARPWIYPPLDARTRRYLSEVAQLQIDMHAPQNCCDADVTTQIVQPGSLWYPEGFRSSCLPYERWAGRSPLVRLVSLQG